MRTMKQRNLYRVMALLICLTIFAGQSGISTVNAATTKTYYEAYGQWLKKHPYKSYLVDDFNAKKNVNSFFLYDIDGDDIPELFTETAAGVRHCIVRIYTYKNGKMTKYKFSSGKAAVFDEVFETERCDDFYICEKDHVHYLWENYTTIMEQEIYKAKSGKLKLYLGQELVSGDSYSNAVFKYTKSGKKISASKFESLKENCIRKKDITKYNNSTSSTDKLISGEIK